MRLLTLLIFLGCSHHLVVPAPEQPSPGMKTPTLILPKNADQDMQQAALIFNQYANSNEFIFYLRQHLTKLDGGNVTDKELAITQYRSCMNELSPIEIRIKSYSYKRRKKVIGAWRKTYLAQNKFKKLDAIERSAHWVHEVAHACGFTHIHNSVSSYPVIKQSFPYQLGRIFKNFIQELH